MTHHRWERVENRWVLVEYLSLPSRSAFREWFPLMFSIFAVVVAVWNLIR